MLFFSALLLYAPAFAIPPNTPITNTASVEFVVAGSSFTTVDSATITSDANAGNSPPYGVRLDPASVMENSSGAVVGDLLVDDVDLDDVHQFSISDPRFVLENNSLRLADGISLDFEAEPIVTLTVQVTDTAGATFVGSLEVNVLNVNEAPTALGLSNSTVIAQQLGSAVGELLVTDPDVGDTFTYLVDDTRFEVDGNTLKLADSQMLGLAESATVTLTVTDAGGLSYSEVFTITATPPGAGSGVNSSINTFLYAPNAGGALPTSVGATQCENGANLIDLATPQSVFGGAIDINNDVPLVASNVLKSGDAAFIQVIDPDANLDGNVIDQIEVTLATASGDAESLLLAESAPNSGIFTGYAQTSSGVAIAANCVLETRQGDQLQLQYTDVLNPLDVAQSIVWVDPLSVVFDSASGRPINGAAISLVNASDGSPATVFAQDGSTSAASTMTSGVEVDEPGAFTFAWVPAGEYVLQVVPPNRFAFPSQVPDSMLQNLAGAPFSLGDAARGTQFQIQPGPAFKVDVPLDLLPISPTTSNLRLLSASSGAGQPNQISAGQCFNGTQFVPSANPQTLALGEVSLPASLPLAEVSRLARGDVLFVQLEDGDQDLDPFAPDEIEVWVNAPQDRERLLLRETNDSTGVFVGYLQSSQSSGTTLNNCLLEADSAAGIEVVYTDENDPQDTAVQELLYAPTFTLFSSSDGDVVSGAVVTLLDAQTGLPANNAVFAADGVTPFPASVTVGGQAEDAAGTIYEFAPGTFDFPLVAAGEYQLAVTPPAGFVFPSQVSDDNLAALLPGPFTLAAGSRGNPFTVDGVNPAAFDIPLDPVDAAVFISKKASKEAAAVGDFVQYQVTVSNTNPQNAIGNALVVDVLPVGFRLVSDSAVVNGIGSLAAFELDVSADGRTLRLPLGTIDAGEQATVSYVTEITAGAKQGRARNSATVVGDGVTSSNTAFADVEVEEELLQSKSLILGQVFEGDCNTANPQGLANARVWLETGVFVVTDAAGKFHFADVEPGSHVVQLDLASLPTSHEVIACEDNTRFAGAADSQFVDLQPGSAWRTDFYVAQKPDVESDIVTRLDAKAQDGVVHYSYHLRGGNVPLENVRVTFMLDDQLAYLEGSARLNGEAIADPAGLKNATAVFKVPDTDDEFAQVLEFSAFVKSSKGLIETAAQTAFATANGRHRSEVSRSALSLNWPTSLVTIAQSIDAAQLSARHATANKQSLLKARRSNTQVMQDTLGVEPEVDTRPAADKNADLQHVGISSQVHEPSRGEHYSRGEKLTTKVSVARAQASNKPYELPALDRGKAPPYDLAWLQSNQTQVGIVWPPENYNPVLPAVDVVVLHSKDTKPALLVDGDLVDPVTFEGTTSDPAGDMSFSRWDNVTISERDSRIEARLLDKAGDTVDRFSRDVHFSGAPAHAELVESESYLVADGLHPPLLAVRLFDRAGYPLRAGTTGEFSVAAPYLPLDKAKHLENTDNKFNNLRYQVLRDGIAYIQLEPTTQTGEVELLFQFDQVRADVVRARLLPGARDWIMVGLLEGSYAHNRLEGDLRGLGQQNLEDRTLTDGRVAFYAKGMVRGDWLLTVAYDTDKKFERKLREQIDPNQFYTLYGDGTEQLYDADSQRKLYLKLERHRFNALFGNFDTGFDRSELARYNRRLNGVQSGYFGKRIEARVFASETDQSFLRDEIPGDGTSGVYRLSHGSIAQNSESVRIVTRDRFATETVLEEQTLNRFVDYTIDYNRGTLIFKQPIFSQDAQFNPIFIEVEYETADLDATEEVVAGARLAYRLDNNDSELAVTYVNDGTQGQGGDLTAADLTWQMNALQKLTIELAQTDTDVAGQGDAYLFEVEHRAEDLAGRVYLREQEESFGLGNQSALEAGTRKFGVEGEYRLSDDWLLRAESFKQQQLEQGTQRIVTNGTSEWRWRNTRLTGGLQSVMEDTATADDLDATQILLGVSQNYLANKLVLRSDAEIDVSSGDGNTDYPSRAIFGVEYEVLKDINVFAEQELSWGDLRDTQDTRFGVRARPWRGADINTTVNRENGENGNRLFATTGLLQQWRINEQWLYDVGFDRVQTLSEEGDLTADRAVFNPNVPPASGSFDGDFTAFFTGFGYRREAWDVTGRVEWHQGDQADKWNVLLGANHQLSEGRVIAASVALINEERADGGVMDNLDMRIGFAWRPSASRWSLLNRTDLIAERRIGSGFDTRTRKWVNNFNANYKIAAHQLSLQLGIKYVLENIDAQEYDGVTSLYGLEYRYDLSPRWDIGVRSAALHSSQAETLRYAYGVSVGHSVQKNMWLSVGYNVDGFNDEDFIAAEYTAKGPYIKFRMKLDQQWAERFLEFAGLSRQPQVNRYATGR